MKGKTIRVILDEETHEKFIELKTYWGTKSNMNTVEKLLSEGEEFLNAQLIKLMPEQEKNVKEHVEARLFSSSTSVSAFVNNVVGLWLEKRKEKMNLNDMTFRSYLPRDERKIASILFENQFNLDGLSGEKIKELTGMDDDQVNRILEKFVNYGLVKELTEEGKMKYRIIG